MEQIRRPYPEKNVRNTCSLHLDIHLLAIKKSSKTISESYDKHCWALLDSILFHEATSIFLDSRETNKNLRTMTEKALLAQWKVKYPHLHVVIAHKNSQEEKGIQAADIIAGAMLRSHELDDHSYIEIIQNKIIKGK